MTERRSPVAKLAKVAKVGKVGKVVNNAAGNNQSVAGRFARKWSVCLSVICFKWNK